MFLTVLAMRNNLVTILDDFRRYDGQIAVVRKQGNRRRATTYGEIARLAGRFAALLAQEKIVAGDRILIWAENSAEWMAAFYGCMLRGVLAAPLDTCGTVEFAARVAADIRPKLIVGDMQLVAQLSAEWPCLAFEDWLAILPQEEAGAVAELTRDTPLQILFTSGTTGDPKGVVLTHGNILASIAPIEQGAQPYLRWEQQLVHPLRILHTLPLSHVFGQTMGLWVPPIFTAEVHFENRLVAPRLIETIRRERISVLAAVPRVMMLLKNHLEAEHPDMAERMAASVGMRAWRRWWLFRDVHREFGLKFWALVSGGGALGGVLEQFWSALGFVVVQGYGMTETSALITLNHPFHVAGGSIGKPLPGREVKLGPDGEVLVRGAVVTNATWSNGALRPREGEWLATGDLAEKQPGGELRFVGRKSEVIVTAAGVNVHPEDLEAAIEQEPGVTGCAVVAMPTPAGPEPCAVLAVYGDGEQAAAAIEQANRRLAEFQRLRHWVLWPEPDLPRTSTGKVRRRAVAAWLDEIETAAHVAGNSEDAAEVFGTSSDWLLALIRRITGRAPVGMGDELRLGEDLQLDSLSRVQLAAALEERLGFALDSELLEQAQTLGDLRALASGQTGGERIAQAENRELDGGVHQPETAVKNAAPSERETYPRWPWCKPLQWARAAFTEAVVRPLVWLMADPKVFTPPALACNEPMLLVANHVTVYDAPLLQYALPGPVRQRMAMATAAEMLEDFRHFCCPEQHDGRKRFYLLGPLVYLLLTALFNVFPLPRRRNFQRSFTHAGDAMDHGYNVLLFPEGARSDAGALAPFRRGIGLLVRENSAPVLPMAIRGLGELKASHGSWFRSGKIEIHVGDPIRFAPEDTEAAITKRLRAEVEKLLNESS